MAPQPMVVEQAEDRLHVPASAASDAELLGAVTALLAYRRRELAERRARENGFRSIERELQALRTHAPRKEHVSAVARDLDTPVQFVADALVLLTASLDAHLGLSGEYDVPAESVEGDGDAW